MISRIFLWRLNKLYFVSLWGFFIIVNSEFSENFLRRNVISLLCHWARRMKNRSRYICAIQIVWETEIDIWVLKTILRENTKRNRKAWSELFCMPIPIIFFLIISEVSFMIFSFEILICLLRSQLDWEFQVKCSILWFFWLFGLITV